VITSIKNPVVKYVRDLLAHKKHRDQAGAFVVEGVRLVEEAVGAAFKPELILFNSSLSERGREILETLKKENTRIEELDAGLLDRVSATETSQGLLAVFKQPVIQELETGEPVLVLDQMRDPGNMGTILRGAAAFGFRTVLLTPGCVDAFSPKALRAGMGAQFKLAIMSMDPAEIHDYCKKKSKPELKILLADSPEGKTCWETDLSCPLCLIIGGEAFGAEPEIRQITDEKVLIPMQANNESLNAAMAASILMYEVYRQRKRQ
jgi:RNA methyltransferase, TrmH family